MSDSTTTTHSASENHPTDHPESSRVFITEQRVLTWWQLVLLIVVIGGGVGLSAWYLAPLASTGLAVSTDSDGVDAEPPTTFTEVRDRSEWTSRAYLSAEPLPLLFASSSELLTLLDESALRPVTDEAVAELQASLAADGTIAAIDYEYLERVLTDPLNAEIGPATVVQLLAQATSSDSVKTLYAALFNLNILISHQQAIYNTVRPADLGLATLPPYAPVEPATPNRLATQLAFLERALPRLVPDLSSDDFAAAEERIGTLLLKTGLAFPADIAAAQTLADRYWTAVEADLR